jgi:NTE family protein
VIGFVLSGGANLGSVHVGMLQALLEAGIKPDVIVGTSIGAVNAAHLAAEPSLENVERLREMWCNVRAGAIFPLSPFHNARALFRDGAFFSVHLWRKFLEQRAQYSNIEDAAVTLRITATDYDEGRSKVFDSGPVLDAVLASTSLPGVFPPYEIDGHYYIDGSISDQLPLKVAMDAGAQTVYVMAVSVPSPPPDRRSPLTILRHSLTILLYPRIRLDALDLPGQHPKLRIIQVPSLSTQVSLWDMSRHQKLIVSAYETTKEFLEHEYEQDEELDVATVPEMEVETQTPEDACPEP